MIIMILSVALICLSIMCYVFLHELYLYFRYITLVRHPIAHLQAAYYENEWSSYVGGLKFGQYIEFQYHRFAKTYDFHMNSPYRNLQLFNLGLNPSQNGNREYVMIKVESVRKQFHLVLVQVSENEEQ